MDNKIYVVKNGEVADIVRKAIFHGHGFDPVHCLGEENGNTYRLALELGDIMYYNLYHGSRGGIYVRWHRSNEYI